MSTTREFENDALEDILHEKGKETDHEPWRHGHRTTFVFEHDDAHWMVTVDCHHDEGLQFYGKTTRCTRVVPVQKLVTMYEPATEPTPTT